MHSFEYKICFIPYHFYSRVARKWVLLKFSTPVERYWRLSTETFGTYIQDAAEKLRLTLKLQHLIPFGYEQF